MMNSRETGKACRTSVVGRFLGLLVLVISILAWITYGTLEGVLGCLAFGVIGWINLFPWILPVIGIPLGILDLSGVLIGMYDVTLNLARVNPSWLTLLVYWVVVTTGMILQLVMLVVVWIRVRSRKYRAPPTPRQYALVHCTIFDGTRENSLINDGTILIGPADSSRSDLHLDRAEVGLILAVGSYDEVPLPPEVKIFDLSGKFVIPGLINAHCHLTGSGKPMRVVNLPDETLEWGLRLIDNPLGHLILHRMMKKNVTNAMHSGVTTLRTLGDPFYLDIDLRKSLERGDWLGPRLWVSGKGICVTGGHGGAMGFIADSPSEVRKRVRENLRHEVDCIKILSTGGVMDARRVGEAGRPQMTVEEIQAACEEAHRAKILVATHCESSEGIRDAIQGGVDTIEHGAPIPSELIPKFLKNPYTLRGYTTLTPTLMAGMGLAALPHKTTRITPVKKENAVIVEEGMITALQQALENDIPLAMGTDASVPYVPHYQFWKELTYWKLYTNLSERDILYHATLGNARALGIEDITGSVEPGKQADLVIYESSPLVDLSALSKPSMVIVRGHVIVKPRIHSLAHLEKFDPLPN